MRMRGRESQARAALVIGLWSSLLGGCWDVASERAARDIAVGRASQAEADALVLDGAAAIRAMSPSELHLWASTPRFEVRFRSLTMAGQRVTLRVENALPTGTLSGAEVTERSADATTTTDRAWEVRLPANGEVTLSFGPADDTVRPFRFAVMGDVQDAIDAVEDVFLKVNAVGVDFLVIVGDLTERGHVDELEQFQREMRALRVPAYVTLGNHELGADNDGPPYHRYFGRGTHSFDYRGARFILSDSASATIAPRALRWIRTWLNDARDRFIFMGMHIAPRDPIGTRSGAFSDVAEANELLDLMAESDVDLCVYGHIHSYYAFDNAGIPAFISGGGGAIPEIWDGIGRHFLVFEVNPSLQTFSREVVRVDQ